MVASHPFDIRYIPESETSETDITKDARLPIYFIILAKKLNLRPTCTPLLHLPPDLRFKGTM